MGMQAMKVVSTTAQHVPNHQSTNLKTRPQCATGCGRALVNNSMAGPEYVDQHLGRFENTNIFFHPGCTPGQTWQQLVKGGISATYEGVKGAIRRHPYITAAVTTAVAGAMLYTYGSAETFTRMCYPDAVKKDFAWCADVASSADPSSAIYRSYEAVKGWARSEGLGTRLYEQLQENGPSFILKKFTKLFVNNPFNYFFGK